MVGKYSCDGMILMEVLGEGSYGVVYKGELSNDGSEVAVKIMKRKGVAYKELRRMSRLDHPNVLKLVGFVPKGLHDACECTDFKYGLWLMLEYMPLGNLLQFVIDRKGGLKAVTMHKFAYQIAVGMNYLHRTVGMVHRDLAARNILVGHDIVKIADFGLCNDYYGDQYYYQTKGKPCPIRWMPPENLPDDPPFYTFAHFSRKGDVWSFGVVLYEMWSRGKNPLDDLTNEQVLVDVKRGTTVLTADTTFHASAWVRDLMTMCFEMNKADRPNFRRIYKFIDENSEFNLY